MEDNNFCHDSSRLSGTYFMHGGARLGEVSMDAYALPRWWFGLRLKNLGTFYVIEV